MNELKEQAMTNRSPSITGTRTQSHVSISKIKDSTDKIGSIQSSSCSLSSLSSKGNSKSHEKLGEPLLDFTEKPSKIEIKVAKRGRTSIIKHGQ